MLRQIQPASVTRDYYRIFWIITTFLGIISGFRLLVFLCPSVLYHHVSFADVSPGKDTNGPVINRSPHIDKVLNETLNTTISKNIEEEVFLLILFYWLDMCVYLSTGSPLSHLFMYSIGAH